MMELEDETERHKERHETRGKTETANHQGKRKQRLGRKRIHRHKHCHSHTYIRSYPGSSTSFIFYNNSHTEAAVLRVGVQIISRDIMAVSRQAPPHPNPLHPPSLLLSFPIRFPSNSSHPLRGVCCDG